MPSKHAEIDALNKIKSWKNIPKQIDLFVVRFNKIGLLSESRPCLNCLQTLEKSEINIKHVYYSTNSGIIVREKFKNMKISPLTYISSGVRNKLKKRFQNSNNSHNSNN